MGRSNAIPSSFFGAIDPKHRIPRNNVLFVGIIAIIGALMTSFERGEELLNFGALLDFMGIYASAFIHYYLREGRKTILNFITPLARFLVCFLLWFSLGWHAKQLGIL